MPIKWIYKINMQDHNRVKQKHTRSYLNSNQNLFLVRCQVVAFSKEDFAESTLTQLPLQDDVVTFDVLHNYHTKMSKSQNVYLVKLKKGVTCMFVSVQHLYLWCAT